MNLNILFASILCLLDLATCSAFLPICSNERVIGLLERGTNEEVESYLRNCRFTPQAQNIIYGISWWNAGVGPRLPALIALYKKLKTDWNTCFLSNLQHAFKTALSNNDMSSLKVICSEFVTDLPRIAYTTFLPEYSTKVWEILIGSGFDINARDLYGTTPLLYAIRKANMPLIKMFLAEGADPNIIHAENSFSPLMYAISSNEKAAFTELLSHGADINYARADGQSALSIAINYDQPEYAEFILNEHVLRFDNELMVATFLRALLIHNSEDILLRVLKEKDALNVNVNARDATGSTALHIAAEFGRASIIEALLAAGADPNLYAFHNGAWVLPIQLAIKNDSRRCFDLLMDAGTICDENVLIEAEKSRNRHYASRLTRK